MIKADLVFKDFSRKPSIIIQVLFKPVRTLSIKHNDTKHPQMDGLSLVRYLMLVFVGRQRNRRIFNINMLLNKYIGILNLSSDSRNLSKYNHTLESLCSLTNRYCSINCP